MVFSPRDEAEIAQVAIRVSRGEPSKRTEGAELCGGDSIPEVHGGRGCRPPRSRPGSEGWSWGPAEAAEGACEAAAAGTGLRTAEAVPRSLQQLSTRCGPPQTDCPSVGTACPPPPALLISSLTFALPLSRLLFPLCKGFKIASSTCPQTLYELMLRCWSREPFTQLHRFLADEALNTV
ncbi:uncharacterized protein LOC143441852 [Arvicanthis niloticus]|uniref:uncharacterized protein LOC143441852 n=1 Tax=Arvicanthis niloticus TaxID=61156 RepID=UPI00403CA9CE